VNLLVVVVVVVLLLQCSRGGCQSMPGVEHGRVECIKLVMLVEEAAITILP
jgi:hypothetical protein